MLCAPQVSAGCTRPTINPLLVKVPKYRITAHLHSFIAIFLHLWKQPLRVLTEHEREFQQGLLTAYVDLRKAFDSVIWDALLRIVILHGDWDHTLRRALVLLKHPPWLFFMGCYQIGSI